MAHFLFPSSDSVHKPKRKDDYPTVFGDIVRGGADAMDALILFRKLVTEDDSEPGSSGYLSFDSHVGDTGCQLRAGMFIEVFGTFRFLSTKMPEAWGEIDSALEAAITNLKPVISKAQEMCNALTRKKTKPKDLGLGPKVEKPSAILQKLGWDESSLMRPNTIFNAARKDAAGNKLEDDNMSSEWDIFHVPQLFRLIVYSYILSKYKTFSYYNGTPNGALDVKAVDAYTMRLMEPYWLTASASVKKAGMRRIETEFRDLQIWSSNLTVAWLEALALRSACISGGSSLIGETTQTSILGIKAAATFPGYLLEREFLARQPQPLILVDRHFCHDGYHVNVFEAKMTYAVDESKGVSDLADVTLASEKHQSFTPNRSPFGPSLVWKVSRSSIEELMMSQDTPVPNMVVVGNSREGNYKAYGELVETSTLEDEALRRPDSLPHDGCCEHNEAHIAELMKADHDRLALSFFAIHPSYAFDLTTGEDETDFVKHKMDALARPCNNTGNELSSQWLASRAEADAMGTGPEDMHIFRWQHVCIESKARLGRVLQEALDRADLMPPKGPAV
ncbi:hypothetical protein F5Y18DRAFT_373163 [Xylariaceae sp. FL1019]|nr:hypothetical protein F5Y18DRAFT_373163 [Xylariaceae sp. FL1019]